MNEPYDDALSKRFFTRQPIFDSKHVTWGYALSFGRNLAANGRVIHTPRDEILDTTAGVLDLADSLFGKGRKVMLSFGEESFLDETPYALPPARTVIEVPGCSEMPKSAAVPLEAFRADGFSIALDLIQAGQACTEISATADVFVVDVTGRDKDEIQALVQEVSAGNHLLMARGVNSAAEWNLTRDLGFDLMQGAFFQTPETVESRAPTSHEASRLKLLGAIEKPDPDFDGITETVQHDATISYRLLSYLNSPAIGLTDPITSIKQAMLLLGWKTLKNWLRVVVLTDINPNPEARQLLRNSVQRGKFFELAARSQPHSKDNPDQVFLLGLFSLLEPLLGIPIADISKHLPLECDISKALTGEAECRCSLWLQLAKHYENAEWDKLDATITQLDLYPLTVSVAYYKSIMWTESFFSNP